MHLKASKRPAVVVLYVRPSYPVVSRRGWISFKLKLLLGFLWIHVQFPAEEQNRYPEVLKFPEPSCC